MSAVKSIWIEVLAWLKAMDSKLIAEFPTELPTESSPDFWFRVARIEMSTREDLSTKVRSLIFGGDPSSMSVLEAWLYRRRVEWAGQLTLVKVQEGVEPEASLAEVLEWLLIESWDSDGCIGLWNHAERGGKPHPSNPDGLSPV